MGIKRNNQLFKKILAIFLSILMIATTIPLNVFASSNMNLGEKDNNSTISVKKETHYGHELHTTTVGGETYPLFCIEYGKTFSGIVVAIIKIVKNIANIFLNNWLFLFISIILSFPYLFLIFFIYYIFSFLCIQKRSQVSLTSFHFSSNTILTNYQYYVKL